MFTPVFQQVQAQADAAGDIDWLVQIDSTIVRARQKAASTGRKGEKYRQDEPNDHALSPQPIPRRPDHKDPPRL
ncbi:hypothetical protein ACIPJS_39735 [Streptomyces sp. NPDC086783]|uniref:hypothetical protein n=1 Tax=Streptomyces sp. NPDC086783 TaxID=3365758 RepID=UPI00382EA31C